VRYQTDNKSTVVQAPDMMRWLPYVPYIPGKATLVLLFKAARIRLMSNSASVDALSNARIASATEEMNLISDDIRDAKNAGPSTHEQARPATELDYPRAALPTADAASATLRYANPNAPGTDGHH
jgi:hypothetical protein